jgi:hypothetical protein
VAPGFRILALTSASSTAALTARGDFSGRSFAVAKWTALKPPRPCKRTTWRSHRQTPTSIFIPDCQPYTSNLQFYRQEPRHALPAPRPRPSNPPQGHRCTSPSRLAQLRTISRPPPPLRIRRRHSSVQEGSSQAGPHRLQWQGLLTGIHMETAWLRERQRKQLRDNLRPFSKPSLCV